MIKLDKREHNHRKKEVNFLIGKEGKILSFPEVTTTQEQHAEKLRQIRREYARAWRAKNRAHIREYSKAWRKANPEKIRQYQEKYWNRKLIEKKAAEAANQ